MLCLSPQVVNVAKLFNLDKGNVDVTCYVIDNHRPFHLANIHSPERVVLFMGSNEQEHNIPDEGMLLYHIDS